MCDKTESMTTVTQLDYTMQKIHQFPFPVKSVELFDADHPDFFLIDNQHIYDVRSHELLHTFRYTSTKKLESGPQLVQVITTSIIFHT